MKSLSEYVGSLIATGIIVGLICGFAIGISIPIHSENPVVIMKSPPTFIELREGAQAIMTETRAGGNTKVRIGMMYMAIITKMEHIQYQVDSLKSLH
jgi:hypothetical protein